MTSHLRAPHTLAATALVLMTAVPALAGPPLVCFPFDIGSSTSLPWSGSNGWEGSRADYDVSRLTSDTIALLTPTAPVIVRMETLRRAAIYATRDTAVARTLLDTMLARVKTAARGGSTTEAALATFDAGYLIETYRQTAYKTPANGTLVAGLDGYAMVRAAIEARHADPAMEFAAAIMTMGPGKPGYPEHVRQARAGVTADQLLARNIDHLPQ